MQIKTLHVKNFRSIVDQELSLLRLTALIGRNNVGKSSFLQALRMFYEPLACKSEHFYDRNTSDPIQIIVTYDGLSDLESQQLGEYVVDGEVKVKKEFQTPDNKGEYYGCCLRNPAFAAFRNAKKDQERRAAYDELRSDYPTLARYANKDSALEQLSAWEAQNPGQCSRVWDDGIDLSSPVKDATKINLTKFTRLILVPAVLDASTEVTSSKGTLAEIIALAAEAVMPQPERIADLKRETQTRYNEVLASASPELSKMESELNTVLSRYGRNSKIKLEWDTQDVIKVKDPRPEVQILADKYATSVDQAGHGSQRALIMALLQYRVQAQLKQERQKSAGERQSILIAIEEPELYQHPLALHSLGQTFKQLTADSGSGDQLQVIYTTHSPLLVDPIDLENLRILRKIPAELNKPPQTEITMVDMTQVMDHLFPEVERTTERKCSRRYIPS
ncbi:MAG: AAA family ATPase [Halobacteriota archaeon]